MCRLKPHEKSYISTSQVFIFVCNLGMYFIAVTRTCRRVVWSNYSTISWLLSIFRSCSQSVCPCIAYQLVPSAQKEAKFCWRSVKLEIFRLFIVTYVQQRLKDTLYHYIACRKWRFLHIFFIFYIFSAHLEHMLCNWDF